MVEIKKHLLIWKSPEQPIGQLESHYSTLFPLLSSILRAVYVIASIILLFFIFIGGLGMILNTGNTEKQKQSSKTLGSAVLGFTIIFVSYWLIKIIEIITQTKIISL